MPDSTTLEMPPEEQFKRELALLANRVDKLLQMQQQMSEQILVRLDQVRLATTTYLGDHLAVTHLNNGCRMFVDTRSRDIGAHLLTQGRWEQESTNAFQRLLAPGQRVIDVGANLGWYSLLSAKAVGHTGRVLAIEPNSHFARLVAMSLEINGFTSFSQVVNAAVGDIEGLVNYECNDDFPGSAVVHPASSPRVRLGAVRAVTVQCLKLDTLAIENFGQFADVVKMDVEGWEGMVLRGFSEHLRNGRQLRMMIEWCSLMDRAPANRIEAAKLLHSHQFVPFRIVQDGGAGHIVSTTWSALLDNADFVNLLVMRQDDPLAASMGASA
jgi:FkbM family methyltransferase